jgi:hypothetical protein
MIHFTLLTTFFLLFFFYISLSYHFFKIISYFPNLICFSLNMNKKYDFDWNLCVFPKIVRRNYPRHYKRDLEIVFCRFLSSQREFFSQTILLEMRWNEHISWYVFFFLGFEKIPGVDISAAWIFPPTISQSQSQHRKFWDSPSIKISDVSHEFLVRKRSSSAGTMLISFRKLIKV